MMSHKAFAFDWDAFVGELQPLLTAALAGGDPDGLASFIDTRREHLSDPYEGDQLPADWRAALENHDVHEYGDYALTRFYDPADDHGLHEGWAGLRGGLPGDAAAALLGSSVGPPDHPFDAGRYGSYFQTPDQVRESLAILEALDAPELTRFVDLLRRCAIERRGVYVTF